MTQPGNAAADQVVQAQSIIRDLTTQLGEVQAAINRQQALVDALTPIAEWAPAEPEPEPVEGGDE